MAAEKNFLVSICENGGREAYRDLISALEKLVEPVNTTQTILDERVADIWSGRLLQGNQRIRIYRAKSNIGYAGGVNICIRQIDPAEPWSALWVLNPDTEPDPNALTALAARARECDYGMVASRIVVKSTQRVQTYGGRWRPLMARGFNIGWDAPRDAVPDVAEIEASMMYVPGGSMFVTREYVEGVGLLDERYFLYCEEVDWCFRRGHRRIGYAHNSIVYHSVGTTIGSNFDPKEAIQAFCVSRREKQTIVYAALLSGALSIGHRHNLAVDPAIFGVRGCEEFLRGLIWLVRRATR